MKHLGDITRIDGGAIAPVDVITGGSPCQDLSVAGKRAGLAGERSGLYMEQIRIIREMRNADILRGRTGQLIRPRFMVWENVPGAFSSNRGEDFRAVLEEAARTADPNAVVPGPPAGRWPASGAVLGDGWSIAWRVLDAQFWGVPQRRRRIALVADFGGRAAPEILFIRKGVFGDIDQGPAAGEASSAGAGGGAYPAVANCLKAKANLSFRADSDTLVYTAFHLTQDPISTVEKTPCLSSGNPKSGQATIGVCAAFSSGQGAKSGGIGYAEELSPTLKAAASGSNRSPCVLSVAENQRHELRMADVFPSISTGGGKPGRVYPCVFENHGQDSRLTGPLKVAPTVAQKFGTGGNNTPLVVAGLDCRNGTENPELSATLQAKANSGQSLNCTHPVRVGKTVRRLTPLEYERLQGFPDGWTDIGPWTDGKGKVHKESSDSARYKALGNSIALPPWRWVLLRITACYERPATLGSLFDGIGGFPLIWERLNGPGTALWASEIEEFPIAVTKYHFGE